jgi:hypothetical protein
MESGAFVIPPRLPLGEFYEGECRASSEPHLPSGQLVTKFCNNGYGRGACDRFPADSAADAVRFHIATAEPGAVRVQFVLEKACWPTSDGFLDYAKSSSQFLTVHPNAIVQRQAEAFLDSFLRRSLL